MNVGNFPSWRVCSFATLKVSIVFECTKVSSLHNSNSPSLSISRIRSIFFSLLMTTAKFFIEFLWWKNERKKCINLNEKKIPISRRIYVEGRMMRMLIIWKFNEKMPTKIAIRRLGPQPRERERANRVERECFRHTRDDDDGTGRRARNVCRKWKIYTEKRSCVWRTQKKKHSKSSLNNLYWFSLRNGFSRALFFRLPHP